MIIGMASVHEVRKCKACAAEFIIGSGTGRRKTKRFCSTRCRVAWNRMMKPAPVRSPRIEELEERIRQLEAALEQARACPHATDDMFDRLTTTMQAAQRRETRFMQPPA